MSRSFFAAMARMSRLCCFVSFLIGVPFVRRGGASRDDANDFFAVLLKMSVDNQQDRARSDGSDGYPAFLIRKSIVTLRNCIGIIENENGSLKPNIMLAKVLAVLVFIPSESHTNGDDTAYLLDLTVSIRVYVHQNLYLLVNQPPRFVLKGIAGSGCACEKAVVRLTPWRSIWLAGKSSPSENGASP